MKCPGPHIQVEGAERDLLAVVGSIHEVGKIRIGTKELSRSLGIIDGAADGVNAAGYRWPWRRVATSPARGRPW